MELKVWVEGIQRVVCGVSDTTTCRDVVHALAHATARTGRFTLIERWRQNERLLAPQERPAKVLMKWGEYSGDVQFILLRSPLEKSPSGRRLSRQRSGAGRAVSPQPVPLPHIDEASSDHDEEQEEEAGEKRCVSMTTASTTVMSPELQRRPAAELRLADHVLRGTVGVVRGVQQQQQQQHDVDQQHGVDRCRWSCSPAWSSCVGPDKTAVVCSLNDSVSSSSTVPACNNSQCSSSQRSFITPPPYRDPPPASTHRRTQPPPYRDPPPPHHSLLNTSNCSSGGSVSSSATESNAHCSLLVRPCENGQISSSLKNGTTINTHTPHVHDTLAPSTGTIHNHSSDNERRQLNYIVHAQKQQLQTLRSHINKTDSEAEYVERLQREYEVQLAALQKETGELERMFNQRQTELLSADTEEGMLARELSEKQRISDDIVLLKQKLAECDNQLCQYQQQLSELSEQLPAERAELQQQQCAVREHVLQLVVQLQQLQSQQTAVCEQRVFVDQQLGRLSGQLDERESRMRCLADELTQLNMDSLSLAAAHQLSTAPPTCSRADGANGVRVSRQLVGPARQLETAVPSSRNPHGVWV